MRFASIYTWVIVLFIGIVLSAQDMRLVGYVFMTCFGLFIGTMYPPGVNHPQLTSIIKITSFLIALISVILFGNDMLAKEGLMDMGAYYDTHLYQSNIITMMWGILSTITMVNFSNNIKHDSRDIVSISNIEVCGYRNNNLELTKAISISLGVTFLFTLLGWGTVTVMTLSSITLLFSVSIFLTLIWSKEESSNINCFYVMALLTGMLSSLFIYKEASGLDPVASVTQHLMNDMVSMFMVYTSLLTNTYMAYALVGKKYLRSISLGFLRIVGGRIDG